MSLLLLSFLAGILTVLAPCVLPLLPVILAGGSDSKNKFKGLIIITSLSFSIFIFTLVVKATTLAFAIDPIIWIIISGAILTLFGLISIFPSLWDLVAIKFYLSAKSDTLLEHSTKSDSWFGPILIGLSLGPVFSSCSPTYMLLVATILPANLLNGILYLLAYILGLAIILLLVSIFGYKITKKLRWGSDPNGLFKKILGLVFVIVGLSIITGIDKQIETLIVSSGFTGAGELEQWLQSSLK